jgi:hypothetical protein
MINKAAPVPADHGGARSGAAQPPRDPALVRNRFMKGLGISRAGALD